MTSTVRTTHRGDGYIFKSPFTADPDAPVANATGTTIVLRAKVKGSTVVVGVGSVIAANELKGVFAVDTLEVGDNVVQMKMLAAGQQPKTILEFTLKVLETI